MTFSFFIIILMFVGLYDLH